MKITTVIKKLFMPNKIFDENEQNKMARSFCNSSGKLAYYNELDIKAFDAFRAGKGPYNPRPLSDADIPQEQPSEQSNATNKKA